jgi:3-isopropylmalate/(R)-2-methylmalate dehydratase small subunit
MQAFTRLEGVAATLLIDNVDTDAIIPSKETQSVSRSGYGVKLFSNWRYLPGNRAPNPDFILNNPPFDRATILISGRNFGCGSSREAAVWALGQFGIRAVLAESFGAIFRNNCIRNGLLPIALAHEKLERICAKLASQSDHRLIIDLQDQTIALPGSDIVTFEIDAIDRENLLLGLDEIAATLKRRDEIEQFRNQDRRERPWLYLQRQR